MQNKDNAFLSTTSSICKQLGSRWDAEQLGVSPRSKLFDTRTTFSSTLSHIEALWKLKQTRSLADDNLFVGLRLNTSAICRLAFCSKKLFLYCYIYNNFIEKSIKTSLLYLWKVNIFIQGSRWASPLAPMAPNKKKWRNIFSFGESDCAVIFQNRRQMKPRSYQNILRIARSM